MQLQLNFGSCTNKKCIERRKKKLKKLQCWCYFGFRRPENSEGKKPEKTKIPMKILQLCFCFKSGKLGRKGAKFLQFQRYFMLDLKNPRGKEKSTNFTISVLFQIQTLKKKKFFFTISALFQAFCTRKINAQIWHRLE